MANKYSKCEEYKTVIGPISMRVKEINEIYRQIRSERRDDRYADVDHLVDKVEVLISDLGQAVVDTFTLKEM